MDTEIESPQHLTEEPAAEVAPVDTRGRGRWAWEDPGAGRLSTEADRIIRIGTDLELVEGFHKMAAEIQRRSMLRPAFFETYGLISTLPKIEPTKGLFAGLVAKPKKDS